MNLRAPPARVESFRQLLTQDERRRADLLRFPQDRDGFIVSRGKLRALIGNYLGTMPGTLRFIYTQYGKPSLVGTPGPDSLRFNVSHSRDLALFAFARGREVGVDVEYIRSDLECDQLATRFFSSREVEALQALPSEHRTEAFFNCWTRKEAFIKAVGEGLSCPLDSFDVSLGPYSVAALLDLRHAAAQRQTWSLRDLAPAPGYAAALAVEGNDWQLDCWQG
jgi:4'-phosphopantetheinyl transferase